MHNDRRQKQSQHLSGLIECSNWFWGKKGAYTKPNTKIPTAMAYNCCGSGFYSVFYLLCSTRTIEFYCFFFVRP